MKIAAVQMDVGFGEVERNLASILQKYTEAHANGAALTIFPECALTGYGCDSLDEARQLAQPIPGPATEAVAASCRRMNSFVVMGMIEAAGERVFNAAVLIGPQGVVGTYRKIHLPYLGLDRFATHGDRPFAVHAASHVNVGMNICFDAGFPEAARCLTLLGADLVVLPTNWPSGAECMADFGINTRAMENNVYFAAVNRIGTERGFRFIGRSRICDPNGNTMAVAPADEAMVLYAEIDPSWARRKRIVRVPEKHIIDRLADRRPEMYGSITQPHQLPRPGRDGGIL